jgi:phage I-like protein
MMIRAAMARAIMTTAEGKAPHAVRLWRAGWNITDKGRVKFTPRSAKLVMKAFEDRGNPIVFDYEHESLLPLEQRGGAPMKGIASAPQSALEVRADENGKPELWAIDIGWTPEAARQIETGERRQISPVSDFDRESREILAIVNVALCREGATHHGTILASADKGTGNMEELIQKIIEALQAGDFEMAETLVQQAEGMDGGGDNAMVKMARGACAAYAAKPGEEPAGEEPKPDAAGRPMAATRDLGRFAGDTAFTRAMGQLEAATKRADRAAVVSLIAASRDCFDPADEREHLTASDPEATERHIKSMRRKLAAGTLAASRRVTERKEPVEAKTEDASFGLDPFEMEAATKAGLSFKDYAAHKGKANLGPRAAKGSN